MGVGIPALTLGLSTVAGRYLSIVLSESVHVFAPNVVDSLATGIMVAVTLASMALNVWALLRHR
jgi:hypothetical protein